MWFVFSSHACVSVSVSALVDTLDYKATESIEDVSASACVSAARTHMWIHCFSVLCG